MKSYISFSLLFLAGGIASLEAAERTDGALSVAEEPSVYDEIWGLADLYENEDNAVIQELSLTGRQQVDWYYFDADQGNDEAWINRRTRLGLKARMFQTFTVKGEVDLDLQHTDPLYNKLTDAYIKWSPSKAFSLTAGKHGANFTLDGSTSSTRLLAIDRSNLANNFWFPDEYMPGVSAGGKSGNWIYNLSWFSSGEASSEFGHFNAGSFGLVNLGYDFAEALRADKAVLRLDLVYQDEDPGNTFTRPFETVGSLNFAYEKGRFGLGTDLVAADGYGGQPDGMGIQVMPSLFFTDARTWQGVLRYTYLESDGDNGLRFARYENAIVNGRADEYQEIYAGLNYYLYGHKLKLQAGVQYASANDAANDGGEYDGWGATTALRVSW